MNNKNKGNMKAIQSKKWMEEALFRLMKIKPYEKITIKDITETAGLSRRTFYRNYEEKDDILLEYFRCICKVYESNLKAAESLLFSDIAYIFFSTMENYLEFLSLINKHELIELLIKEMDKFLFPIHQELKGIYDKELSNIALTFSIGGFGRVLVLWLNEEIKKSPYELSQLMKKALELLK